MEEGEKYEISLSIPEEEEEKIPSGILEEEKEGVCCLEAEAARCFRCVPTSRYISTVPLMTPYDRTLGPEDVREPEDLPLANYRPYDLFCLKTKLQAWLSRKFPSYTLGFSKQEYQGVMRVTVDLYDGGTWVPLEASFAAQVQRVIDREVARFPDEALLMDVRTPWKEKTRTWTLAWRASLLPFLDLKPFWDSHVEKGRIYVNLKKELEYFTRYRQLALQLQQRFLDYDRRGVIPLSERLHGDLISQWKLTKIHDVVDSEQTEPLSLWEPLWKNASFAPSMVAFLYQRLRGETRIRIPVGDNWVRRHFVARALNEHFHHDFSRFEFYRTWVYVEAPNADTALELTSLVEKAQEKSEGKVEFVPRDSLEDLTTLEQNVLKQYPFTQGTGYRILDTPSYIFSYGFPRETHEIHMLEQK